MKRILALSMVVIMVLMIAVTSFATIPSPGTPSPGTPSPGIPSPGIPSPGVDDKNDPVINTTPTVMGSTNESPDCSGKIVVSAYTDRDDLSAASKAEIEAAYKNIKETADLGTLSVELGLIAEENNVTTDKLSVVQIFDISCVDCDDHDAHGAFTIIMMPTAFERFMALMHYVDGEWEFIQTEKTENGIKFIVDKFSPFAVVVHDDSINEPTTPENPVITTAPTLVSAANESKNCIGSVSIRTYENRDQLSAEAKAQMEAAYATVTATSDLGTLNADLKKLAKERKIETTKLSAVSVFDISCEGCDNHAFHGSFTVKIRPESTKNFMAVMHFTDGKWELLECKESMGDITFEVDSLSPFMLIEHDGSAQDEVSPMAIAGVIAGAVVVAVGAGVAITVVVNSKKKKA